MKDVLSMYQKEELIVPGLLAEKMNLSLKEVYLFLEEERKQGKIEYEFVPFCPYCSHVEEKGYSTIKQIPVPFSCKQCEKELDVFDHTYVYYRKK